ncbi:uncharacterized protein LOC120443295 [Oreochromis aureus]|uniref:uncharacterized protein LOC120443295 n=1 Tax=Oreochromis aureus TaxID=47969 RepID=UPI0019536C54|nr:uncharacterized protein LOC120443295 [Oreochromis aureus]
MLTLVKELGRSGCVVWTVQDMNVLSVSVTSTDLSPPVDTVRTLVSSVQSLQQPSISLRYDGGSVQGPKSAEITGGSSFEFTCSITSRYTPGRFMLIFSGSNQKYTKPAVRNSARFSFPAAEYEHWGRYSCVYEINVSMKEFQSSESPPIHVIITFPLQQPSISLTSPNGGLVWGPAVTEVTGGSSIDFICTIQTRYTPGRFRLFFSGSNQKHTEPAVRNSASFTFPAAEYEHQGSYSCVYELLLPSRTFTSAESAPIRLIITFPWWLLVVSAAPGILVLLLVLLVVALVLWRRRRARRFDPNVLIQMAATNRYEDDDEEEEEERDYVNVEPVKIKRKCGEQAGVADEESDNHDYVNIDDEIESTDDENDYVNVTDGC